MNDKIIPYFELQIQTAKDFKSQFGENAKYVALEIIEELKRLIITDSNMNNVILDRIDYMRMVKCLLE